MAANVYRKRSGSVTVKERVGKSKSEEIAVCDDMTIGAMKEEIVRKLAGGRTTGEISMAKESQSGGEAQIIGGELLTETDPNNTYKGEQQEPKKSNSGQAKIMKEEDGTETKSVTENEENTRTLKRKRGADGEMVLAYLSSQEGSSPRLRPRQVPTFRLVDLGENDDNRIVDKRIKVYWPKSRKWFSGHVKAFDDKKGLHSILYDDGDKEELDLRTERFELEVLPTEGFNLKADSISKKKGRGLNGNEVSALMLPETAFKAGDAKEAMDGLQFNVEGEEMMTPEAKKKNESKKMSKIGSSKLRRKGTIVKEDLTAKMKKMDADMDVDVKPDDEVKKSKLDADVNVEKSVKVDHHTNNDKAEVLEEGEKNAEGPYEGQATALDLASEKNKVSLEDCNLNGDTEDKKKLAETENITDPEDAVARSIEDKKKLAETESITAPEDAVVRSIFSIRSMRDNLEDLSPNVEEDGSKEISAQGTPDVDTVKIYNETKPVSGAASKAAYEVSVDLQQPPTESSLTVTGVNGCTVTSKMHLPKNPDILQENLEVEKNHPEELSKEEMKSGGQKSVEGGKKESN